MELARSPEPIYWRANAGASARADGRTVVFDAGAGRYRGLDGVGARIWELVEGGVSASAAASVLAGEYEVSEERLRADAGAFLEKLAGDGLVTRREATETAPTTAACALALVAARGALRTLGAARALALCRHAVLGCPKRRASDALLRDAARANARAAALLPARVRCFEQSLALYVLLRRAGFEARFCLGVQPFLFAGHAWVEHRGAPVNDTAEGLKPFVVALALED
jgi:Transglutaminase-like superfamily/Coenzyme PQQ synthesis protein D (PqqD)